MAIGGKSRNCTRSEEERAQSRKLPGLCELKICKEDPDSLGQKYCDAVTEMNSELGDSLLLILTLKNRSRYLTNKYSQALVFLGLMLNNKV